MKHSQKTMKRFVFIHESCCDCEEQGEQKKNQKQEDELFNDNNQWLTRISILLQSYSSKFCGVLSFSISERK